MKKLLMIILFTCACNLSQAQVNYVLNPDFEQYTYCPTQYDQIDAAKYWNAVDSTGNTSCRPEYCNKCSQSFFTSIPDNGKFYQNPRSGNGLVQVFMFTDENTPPLPPYYPYRDYLQGRLYKKLIAGKSYCVSFYANLTEASQYGINHIGAFLDDGKIDTTNRCSFPLNYITPQIYTNNIIKDTVNWIKIDGNFIANGTEKFITIGNFSDKAHTTYDSIILPPQRAINHYTWYLIDDVSVIESDLPADAGPDRHITAGDSTYIGRTPEIGLECKWYRGNALIDSGASIWVKPTQTTTYRVEQTLCGIIKTDSVTVSVWKVGINNQSKTAQQYRLSPNPNDGKLIIQQAVPSVNPVIAEVLNATGSSTYKGRLGFTNGIASLDIRPVASGLYLLHLQDENSQTYTLKFTVK